MDNLTLYSKEVCCCVSITKKKTEYYLKANLAEI